MQRVFLVKKAYELKEIFFVQLAFITEYPKDGTPSYSVFKNILSSFQKHGLVEHVLPRYKNLGQKQKKAKNSSKTWSRIFLNCQSGKRHLMLFSHTH